MRACRSALTVGVILVAGLSVLSAQGADPRSRFVAAQRRQVQVQPPGPAPKSQTLKIEAVGKGRESDERDRAAPPATRQMTEYTADYDGKPHPLEGLRDRRHGDAERIDSHTTERADTKGGKTM